MTAIHTFDNGIKIYDHHLIASQRARYQHCNVHEEDEEKIFLDTIQDCPHGSCFVSVGTAVGYYPLLTRQRRPDIRLCCFEPLPRHRDYFLENIILNGHDPGCFEIFDLAISTGSMELKLVDENFSSHVASASAINRGRQLLRRLLKRQQTPQSITVQAIRLVDVFQTIKMSSIALLQMDIQGHEEAVLRTYFNTISTGEHRIERFLIGTHGDSIHQACARMLHDNGYTLLVDNPDTLNQPDGILLAKLNP
ncbi:MAG: FkbM family methyltransferase [Cyanobacteriota bacterium]|nr:FkbM family methyltransferase [Cyanobacteriota bacterium]